MWVVCSGISLFSVVCVDFWVALTAMPDSFSVFFLVKLVGCVFVSKIET